MWSPRVSFPTHSAMIRRWSWAGPKQIMPAFVSLRVLVLSSQEDSVPLHLNPFLTPLHPLHPLFHYVLWVLRGRVVHKCSIYGWVVEHRYSQHLDLPLQLQVPSAERNFSPQSLLSFPPNGENFCPGELLYSSHPPAICSFAPFVDRRGSPSQSGPGWLERLWLCLFFVPTGQTLL